MSHVCARNRKNSDTEFRLAAGILLLHFPGNVVITLQNARPRFYVRTNRDRDSQSVADFPRTRGNGGGGGTSVGETFIDSSQWSIFFTLMTRSISRSDFKIRSFVSLEIMPEIGAWETPWITRTDLSFRNVYIAHVFFSICWRRRWNGDSLE